MSQTARQGGASSEAGLVRYTTEAQREILASVALGDDASCAFNMSVAIDFDQWLDRRALARAVQQLGERHQLLRARFAPGGEQLCIDPEVGVELRVEDLSAHTGEALEAELSRLRSVEVSEPFRLDTEHAWRVTLVQMASTSLVLVTVHHVVADGWSLAVMRNDLESLYNAAARGVEPELEPANDFDDYLQYLDQQARNGTHDRAADYWVGRFADGAPAFDFPLDHARPPQRSYAAGRCDVRVPEDVTTALRALAREQGTSVFNVLFAAFYSFLYRSSGCDDLVVGVPAAGHSVSGLYEMVGHCINILPVRQRVDGAQRFDALLDATRSTMLDAQEHQELTFGELVAQLQLPRDPSRIPLVTMLFNIDQDPGEHNFGGAQGRANSVPHQFENFEIFCNILDRRGELTIEWAYNTQLFSAQASEHRVHSFIALLRQIARAPRLQVDEFGLLSALDRAVYSRVNATATPLPQPATVAALLQGALAQHAEAPALVAGEERLSYGELHGRAARLANYLREQGVEPGDWVALCLERDADMVVAILALVQLGAVYVPLDPAYPAERIAYIVEDAQAKAVLTQSALQPALPPHAGETICLDRLGEALARQPAELPPAAPLAGDDLIYVIYTSGSTGKPKGVRLKHANVANFLASMAERPGLGADDCLLAVTTLSFDIAVLELLLPLCVGARVALATREQATDAEALQALMREQGATTLQATPATWRMLLQAGWLGDPGLKALVGGEALPRELAWQLAACTAELWNMYGPTETAIWSTCERIAAGGESFGIGRPIGNTQVHVIDDRGHPAPVGLPGELLIGGEGVCDGYHRRADLSAQVFIDDPFSDRPGARLYRTRDRVKLLPDGRLEYLERLDSQVKVRGYRIELGEIEAVLGALEGVRECAVLAREDEPGDVRLVAYVSAAGAELDRRELSLGLRQHLPEFMQPQHIVAMDEMPRTPNGKLDRKALPAPSGDDAERAGDAVPARSDTERWVVDQWRELLGAEGFGVDDNFFALGGHSLLAMRFIASSRELYDSPLSLRMLLSDTLAQVAATLNPGDAPRQGDGAPRAAAQTDLQAYFCGRDGAPFFCAYHAPAGAVVERAILIAQPLGHEYQRSHRALQELAAALSRRGCAVLRFDYRNTGDSAGEPEALLLSQLQRDLVVATDELLERSGGARVDVLSLRAGGLLVDSVADPRWRRHVAWDPVEDGAAHLELLARLHDESLRDWDRYIAPRARSDSGRDELLGYPYPRALREELMALHAERLSEAAVVFSAGVAQASSQPCALQLRLEPNWEECEDTETHLQIPADINALLQLILESER